MLDHDGDENYEPFLIPIDGGFPEPVAAEAFANTRSHLIEVDADAGIAYFAVESRTEPLIYARRCDLATGTVETLDQSPYGAFPAAYSSDHSRVVLGDQYLPGDVVLYEPGENGRTIVYGTPLDEREPGRDYPAAGIGSTHITPSGRGMLLTSAIFDDAGSPGYLDFSRPGEVEPVAFDGLVHTGAGELEQLQHLDGDRYAAIFNIDGCSWVYDVRFDEPARAAHRRARARRGGRPRGRRAARARPRRVVGQLRALVLHRDDADAALRARRRRPQPRTRERALGLAPELLAAGEDASFDSHDGLRVSARLYLPVRAARLRAGRGRSSTSSTAARRARSGPTSPGSRCRSSRS